MAEHVGTPVTVPAAAPSKPAATKAPRRSQGGITIYHGLDVPRLWRFLRLGPPMDWKHWNRVATLFFTAPFNSVLNLLDSAIYSRAVARTELVAPPVFILGHWRSGTTLLQSLMSHDPQFATQNLGEVLFPGHFLVSERFLRPLLSPFLPDKRPPDNMPAGWDLALEDEMALLILTLYSPFLMGVFPKRPEMYERFFDPRNMTPDERAFWKDTFRYYLKKLTYKRKRRLLLKSPPHTWRIPTLLEMFPGSKFIYIYRDPYAVYSSSLHLRKTMYPENSLAVVDHSADAEEVPRLMLECFKAYERDKGLIPPGDVFEVRFENLEADPVGQLRDMYRTLGLPGWEQLEIALQPQMETHRTFQKNVFSMDPEVRRAVYDRCRPLFEAWGYPSRL